jgi:hypothetical protein
MSKHTSPIPVNLTKLVEHLQIKFRKELEEKVDVDELNCDLIDKLKVCVDFSILVDQSNPPMNWISGKKARYDTTKHEPANFKIEIKKYSFPGLEVKDLVISKAKVEVKLCK